MKNSGGRVEIAHWWGGERGEEEGNVIRVAIEKCEAGAATEEGIYCELLSAPKAVQPFFVRYAISDIRF